MTASVVHVASGREWRGGQRQGLLLARELQRGGLTDQVVITGAGTELAFRLKHEGVQVREATWSVGRAGPRIDGRSRAFPPSGFRRYFGDISDFFKDFRGRSGLLSAATTVVKMRWQPTRWRECDLGRVLKRKGVDESCVLK